MLTKRVNILLDNNLWETLTKKAKDRKTSKGALIREAVKETYFKKESREEQKKATVEYIKRNQHLFKGLGMNYKDLVNYGRKY